MIVSDSHRIAFIHIPKCAGSAVRQQIKHLDSYSGRFEGIKLHPVLGRLDYTHIPLDILQEYWPDVYQKICEYHSIAIMRDPFERFGSALRQTLHFHQRRHLSEMTHDEVRTVALGTIEALERKDNALNPTLIHFLPQVRYVFNGSKKIVSHVYDIRNLNDFYKDVTRFVGHEFNATLRANRNLSFRHNSLIRPAYAINEFLRKHAPKRVHDSMKQALIPLLTHNQSAAMRVGLNDDPDVQAFVRYHYAEDITLYRSLSEPTKINA